MGDPLILPLAPGDPQQLGGHRLIGLLGHGGMGRVYLGISPEGGQVAVKVMHPHYAGDTAFRQRFKREAETAQRVSGPFTAKVLDSGVDERTPWLATEYIPGPTLAQLVSEYGPLPDASVRALAAGLAQALNDIHSRNIVHRDLKPANVILSVTGPRVIDFGIARALDGMGMTATDELLGTVNYMSPEHLAGREVTGQSDVYSLGAVLVYASTGKTPERPILTGGRGDDRRSAPGLGDVPPGLRALIARCLRLDPARRATLADVIRECGRAGVPRLNDWLPQSAAAFVRTRAEQQRADVTTLLNSRRAAPSQQAGWAPPAQAGWVGAVAAGRGRGGAAASLPGAVRPDGHGLPAVAAGPAAEPAAVVGAGPAAQPGGGGRGGEPDGAGPGAEERPGRRGWRPRGTSRPRSGSSRPGCRTRFPRGRRHPATAVSMDDRLAAIAGVLVVLTAVARRTHRYRAHQVVIKAVATYAASVLVILMALRLVQTGFDPLIHIAEYLRWWAVAVVAVAAAVIYPLAGPAR